MREDFTYAVARVRCKERELLNGQNIDALVAASSFDACMQLLFDAGWGDGTQQTAEALLAHEDEKTWRLMRELTPDITVFQMLMLPTDYNNLKACIKTVGEKEQPLSMLSESGTIQSSVIQKAVKERTFSVLPQGMAVAAQEAYQVFMETGDGQLCDALLDSSCLQAIYQSGKASGNEILEAYAELTVAIADIKIAVRSCKTKKNMIFLRTSLVPCETLDIGRLAEAAHELETLYHYLAVTAYAEAAASLQKSYAAFEKWCDDKIVGLIQGQKSNPFTIGPLFAYVVARQNEMSMVRVILSAKLNDLDDSVIKERLRKMYV